MKSVNIVVTGRVQGVGFRFFTERLAHMLNITGYVKNLYNGDVEIVAEGEEKILYQFLDKIKQGPPLAQVINCQTDWYDLKETKYTNFVITY